MLSFVLFLIFTPLFAQPKEEQSKITDTTQESHITSSPEKSTILKHPKKISLLSSLLSSLFSEKEDTKGPIKKHDPQLKKGFSDFQEENINSYFHENEYSVPQYSYSSEIVIEEEISPAERNQYLAKEPVGFEKILQEEILERYKNTLEYPQYYSITFEPGKDIYENFVQKRQEKGLPDTNLNFLSQLIKEVVFKEDNESTTEVRHSDMFLGKVFTKKIYDEEQAVIHNFSQGIIRLFLQKLPIKVLPDLVQFHPNKDLYTTFMQVCHPDGHPAEGAILSPLPDFIEAVSISEEKKSRKFSSSKLFIVF